MTETPKRYQCLHIFTGGHRCGSPCLRGEDFCYYHHTTRRPVQDPRQRQARSAHFDLPMPEDRAAIQLSIGEVLRRIARNETPAAPASSSTACNSPAPTYPATPNPPATPAKKPPPPP